MDSEQKTTRRWGIGAIAALLIFAPMIVESSRQLDSDLVTRKLDAAEIRGRLDQGASPDSRVARSAIWRFRNSLSFCPDQEDKPTWLMLAAANDQADVAQLLIDRHASLELCDVNAGETALAWAIEYGSLHVEQILLDHGARINAVAPMGVSAVMLAVQMDNLEALKMLVDHGAPLNIPADQLGETPLSGAKRNHDKEMIAYLRKHHSS